MKQLLNPISRNIAISEDEVLEVFREIEEHLIPEFLEIFKIEETEFITNDGALKAELELYKLEDRDFYYFLVKELNKLLEFAVVPHVFLRQKENEKLRLFLHSLTAVNKSLLKNFL